MGVMLRATVVGINEYRDEKYRHKARLRFASSDATQVAHLLKSSAMFTVEKVSVLINEEATRKKVRECLSETFMRRGFDSNTIALFYFAGHGIVNVDDQHISLCCHDVDFADPESGGIRLNDIYDWLSSCSAECVIVILDACFSGGIIVGSVEHHRYAAQRALQAIEALRYPDGKTVAIFAACGDDEKARERPALGHGIFTYELLRGWRDGAAQEQKDGIVYLTGLMNFLMQDMTKYTQRPRITMSGGAYPIALWKVEQAAPQRAAPLPPPPTAPHVLPPPQSSTVGLVYHQPTLPSSTHKAVVNVKDRNQLIAAFTVLLVLALVICSVVAFLIIHFFIH